MNRKTEIARRLAAVCELTVEQLEALTYEQLLDIDAVDTNWCKSIEDLNNALVTEYEEVTNA